MKKRLLTFLIIFLLIVCIIVAAVYKKEDLAFVVGICQYAQHESLDAATQGFKDALTDRLGDGVVFEERNANGDFMTCATVMDDLISKDVDLILANSTGALQAAVNAGADIPILGTAVTDYGQMASDSISGTSDLVPADKQAAMVRELFPHANQIGMVYCSSEPNSQYQAHALRAELNKMGYLCESYLFVDSGDLSSAAIAAASECDVLYIPTDNTIASNAELIANICMPNGVPVIAGDDSTCRLCGAATLSVDYYDLGYTTGEMAARILAEGKEISDLPVEYAAVFTKKYNEEICGQLGIDVPGGFVALEGN